MGSKARRAEIAGTPASQVLVTVLAKNSARFPAQIDAAPSLLSRDDEEQSYERRDGGAGSAR